MGSPLVSGDDAEQANVRDAAVAHKKLWSLIPR
jgi:hypothetical protein